MLYCPHCHGPTKPLQVLSFVSLTDYFQCEMCARLSERPKGGRGELTPVERPDVEGSDAAEGPAIPAV